MDTYPGAIIRPHRGKTPQIDPSAFVAPGACLIGDVTVGPQASIWYNCVLRGDLNRITVGARSNVQDGAVVHVEPASAEGPGLPTIIGDDALIGHMAILHGCTIEDGAFVGMGAVVMDGARVAGQAMLAAGALLAPGRKIPAGELWAGRPARYLRALTPDQMVQMKGQSALYMELAAQHRKV